MHDCLEKGRDFHDGGARYNLPMICGVGIGSQADSLAAIKKLVYDEGVITMENLVIALRADFVGHERLRQMLLDRGPKWGNGNDEVDMIAHELVTMFADELTQHPNQEGTPYATNMIKEIDLLPFHRLGLEKYEQLGLNYLMGEQPSIKEEDIHHLRDILISYGFQVKMGG